MPSYHRSFTYDKRGNRTSLVDHLAGETTTYTYDAANQLTLEESVGGSTTYTYDGAGRCTRQETPSTLTDFQYDALGRVTVAEPVSGPVSFTYNGAGQRVKKESPTETTRFLYDFKHLLAELDGAGDTQSLYTYADNEYGDLVSQYDDVEDESSYFHYDAQWSTNALADPAGDATDRWQYSAFGLADHTQGSSDTPHTFVGKQGYYRDAELSLYLLGLSGNQTNAGGRFYNPDLGRFLVPDPLGLDPDSLKNPYRYVNNNPINTIDPSGLWPAKDAEDSRSIRYWRTMILDGSIPGLDKPDETLASFGVPDEGTLRVNLGNDVWWRTEFDWLFTDCSSAKKGEPALYVVDGSQSSLMYELKQFKENNNKTLIPLGLCRLDAEKAEMQCSNVTGKIWSSSEFMKFPDSRDNAVLGPGEASVRGVLVTKDVPYANKWIAKAAAFKKELDSLRDDEDNPATPNDLWNEIRLNSNDLSSVIKFLYNLGTRAFDILSDGVTNGFIQFANAGFQHHFLRGLKSWFAGINIPDGLGDLFSTPNAVQKFIRLGLELVGYTWDNLLNLLIDAVGGKAVNIAVTVFSWIQKFFQEDVFKTVQDWVVNKKAGIKDSFDEILAAFKDDFWVPLKSAILEVLRNQFILEGIKKVVEFLIPGASVLSNVFKALKFLYKNFQKIRDFAIKFKEGFDSMVKLASKPEEAVKALADKVDEALQDGVILAFLALKELIPGVGVVLDKVKNFVVTIKKEATKPIKIILRKIKTFLGPSLLEKLKFFTGEDSNPFVLPTKEGEKLLWVEVSATGTTATATVKRACSINGKLTKAKEVSSTEGGSAVDQLKEAATNVAKKLLPGTISKETNIQESELTTIRTKQQAVIDAMKKGKHTCFVAGTVVHTRRGVRRIETLRVGERVLTYLPSEQLGETITSEYFNSTNLRHLTLSLVYADGTSVQVELLRDLDWIQDYGAHLGGTIYLDMPEMGVFGHADVLAIKSCPEIEESEGRIITATFVHTSGEVYDLKVEAEPEPIGVTGTHPFWSEDREDWVPAIELRIGETLKTLKESTAVESISLRPNSEPVYNIEVEGDHIYRVSKSGVLVHNASEQPEDIWLCYDSCDAAERDPDFGIPRCMDVSNAKSGDPDTACRECNPNCPTCIADENRGVSGIRDDFHPKGQKHYNCVPSGDRTNLQVSIVCGRCCVEVDGRPYARQLCICQGK